MKLLILVLFIPFASSAQGTFQFTWHGQSNYFQASFILTDAEMQPGATFSSPEFTNSIAVDSLSGESYRYKDGSTLFDGGVNPWSFEVVFVDFDHGTELFVHSLAFPPGAMVGTMMEQTMSGQTLYFEQGFWTYSQIPEPSTVSLIAVGTLFFLFRKGRGSMTPPPPSQTPRLEEINTPPFARQCTPRRATSAVHLASGTEK